MTTNLHNTLLLPAFAAGMYALSSSAPAATTFTFTDGSSLDGAYEDGTMTASDDTTLQDIVLSTEDILGFEDSTSTSTITSSSNSHRTNATTSTDALGINSDGNGGHSGEATNFNPGEAWVFSFDTDLTLTSIEFESMNETGIGATISSSAFSDINLTQASLGAGDVYTFGNLAVSAGTELTITATTTEAFEAGAGWRIESLTVNPVPEPSSTALIGLGGLALLLRRRIG